MKRERKAECDVKVTSQVCFESHLRHTVGKWVCLPALTTCFSLFFFNLYVVVNKEM